MSYRPITDLWMLARSKVDYYGAYPAGFLERAKPLIGCCGGVLHCCGGHAKQYPYDKNFLGYCDDDTTMDIDPETKPDILGDATDPETWAGRFWNGVIIDPPYTEADAANYRIPNFPQPNPLLKIALERVPLGGMVGMLHYIIPQPPKKKDQATGEMIQLAKFIACVGVMTGYNNRMRAFSVFQRRV